MIKLASTPPLPASTSDSHKSAENSLAVMLYSRESKHCWLILLLRKAVRRQRRYIIMWVRSWFEKVIRVMTVSLSYQERNPFTAFVKLYSNSDFCTEGRFENFVVNVSATTEKRESTATPLIYKLLSLHCNMLDSSMAWAPVNGPSGQATHYYSRFNVWPHETPIILSSNYIIVTETFESTLSTSPRRRQNPISKLPFPTTTLSEVDAIETNCPPPQRTFHQPHVSS